MKIIKNESNYTLTVANEEFIQIWASLLYMKSQHTKADMPRTTEMIRTISDFLEAPF